MFSNSHNVSLTSKHMSIASKVNRLRRKSVALVSFLGTIALATPGFSQNDSDVLFMIDGKGKDFVYLLCADCHSMQYVLEKTYSRSGWRSAIQRMTDEFGMAELDNRESKLILDYLSKHYGPGSGR